jgi:hypothetical protein
LCIANRRAHGHILTHTTYLPRLRRCPTGTGAQ